MSIDFQIAQRDFKNKTGFKYTARVALVNGSTRNSQGRTWVRPVGGSADDEYVIENTLIALRLRPGINMHLTEGRLVYVAQGFDGNDEIVGNDPNDLEDADISINQLNAASPESQSKPVEWLINGNSYPAGNGDYNVLTFGAIYRHAGGYSMYDNEVLDLTAHIPATANTQVIACIWLDPATNAATVTISSEVSQTTDLRLRSNSSTVTGLINECLALAPVGAIGSWSYLLKSDDVSVTAKNKLYDLRGIIGIAADPPIGHPNPITSNMTLSAGRELITKGDLIISASIELTVRGVLWNE